jgi:hypothetical protein
VYVSVDIILNVIRLLCAAVQVHMIYGSILGAL